MRFNGTNILKLDRLIPYSYPSSDAASVYRPRTGTGEIVTYYNHTGIKLDHDVYYNVTETTFDPYSTNAYVPTVFNIKADTTITLNDMYFPLGINKITIVQTDGKKAKVIDRHGNTIFDGTSKDNGNYILKCITKENDITTQFHANCFCFTGENDEWIEETPNNASAINITAKAADISIENTNGCTVTKNDSPYEEDGISYQISLLYTSTNPAATFDVLFPEIKVRDCTLDIFKVGTSLEKVVVYSDPSDTIGTAISFLPDDDTLYNKRYKGKVYKLSFTVSNNNNDQVYINANFKKYSSGYMSAEDKRAVDSIGDIDAALDFILAIQNNLIGGATT